MGADFSSLPPCLGVPAGTSLPCVFPASLPAAFRPRLGHAARQRDGVRVRPYHFPEFAGRGSLRNRRVSFSPPLPTFRVSPPPPPAHNPVLPFSFYSPSCPVSLSRTPAPTPTPSLLPPPSP